MKRLSDTASDAIRSYQRGLRDAFRPRLAFDSVLIACISVLFLLLVFAIWHEPILQWSGYLIGKGLALIWPNAGAGWVKALTWLGVIGFYLLGVLLLMQIMLELWLMPRIQSVCLHKYPAFLAHKQESGFSLRIFDGFRTFVTWGLGGLLCLLIPVVGGLLLVALSSYLSVRSLVNDSMEGVASKAEMRTLIRTSRPEMPVLGLLISLTAFVPLVGFLVPVIAGASTCHLMMARLDRVRQSADPSSTGSLTEAP